MSLVGQDETPDVSVCLLAYRQTDLLDVVLSQLREHRSTASFEVVVLSLIHI